VDRHLQSTCDREASQSTCKEARSWQSTSQRPRRRPCESTCQSECDAMREYMRERSIAEYIAEARNILRVFLFPHEPLFHRSITYYSGGSLAHPLIYKQKMSHSLLFLKNMSRNFPYVHPYRIGGNRMPTVRLPVNKLPRTPQRPVGYYHYNTPGGATYPNPLPSPTANVFQVPPYPGPVQLPKKTKFGRSGTARSAGFLKTRRKVRHGKKITRARISAKGVYETLERSEVVTATDVQYIGHASAPNERVRLSMYRAFVKALSLRLGFPIKSFSDMIEQGTVGDVWRIYTRDSQEPSSGYVSYDFIYDTDGTLYQDIVNTWEADMVLANPQITLISLEFIPEEGSKLAFKKISLLNASVLIDSKSDLKIQNRSVTDAGDDEIDVDNVPVYGKSYWGRGTGTNYAGGADAGENQFVANRYGVIKKTDAGLNHLREPPFGQLFEKVKREGRIRLDPGHLKTSVLKTRQKMSIGTLVRYIYEGAAGANTYKRGNLGEFRIFAIEKMIQPSGDSSVITLAYEHNLLLGMTLLLGKTDYTTQVVTIN